MAFCVWPTKAARRPKKMKKVAKKFERFAIDRTTISGRSTEKSPMQPFSHRNRIPRSRNSPLMPMPAAYHCIAVGDTILAILGRGTLVMGHQNAIVIEKKCGKI